MNIYELALALQDQIVDYSDDGDGALQDAPQEVKDKHNKRISDLEQAYKLIYPYAVQCGEVHGDRLDVL